MDDQSRAYQPDDNFTIMSLETLKVFSDPLRQQIIEAMFDGLRTVKQIASMLDLPPTKLYYHVNLLEEHQLIRVIDTRIVSGIIEKHYGLAARNYSISRTLLTPGHKESGVAGGLEAAMAATVERTQAEIRAGIESGVIDTSADAPAHRKLLLGRGRSRLDPARAEAFYSRLVDLINEFEAWRDEPEGENGEPAHYTFFFAIYPVERPGDTSTSSDGQER